LDRTQRLTANSHSATKESVDLSLLQQLEKEGFLAEIAPSRHQTVFSNVGFKRFERRRPRRLNGAPEGRS
jgi:hypothetical protein